MFWQAMADLRFRMPGGYFVGPDPSGRARYGPNPRRPPGGRWKIQSGWRAPKLGPGLRAERAGDLANWRVGTVVVGPTKGQATMVQFFTELLGRRPSPVGAAWGWWGVRRAAAVTPPPRTAAGPSSRSGRPRRCPRRPPGSRRAGRPAG